MLVEWAIEIDEIIRAIVPYNMLSMVYIKLTFNLSNQIKNFRKLKKKKVLKKLKLVLSYLGLLHPNNCLVVVLELGKPICSAMPKRNLDLTWYFGWLHLIGLCVNAINSSVLASSLEQLRNFLVSCHNLGVLLSFNAQKKVKTFHKKL